MGRNPGFQSVDRLEVKRSSHLIAETADQPDQIILQLKTLSSNPLLFFDQADHTNSWGRIDAAGWAFVVEAYIPAYNGRIEAPPRFGQSLYGFSQLPEIFRPIRVPEIQIVSHRQRGCP